MIKAREDELIFPIFKGRDNIFTLALTVDGDVVEDLSYVTRVMLRLPGQDLDSLAGASITWNESVNMEIGGVSKSVNVLKFQLGGDITLPIDTYRECRLVAFDTTYPDGLVWLSNITAVVQ